MDFDLPSEAEDFRRSGRLLRLWILSAQHLVRLFRIRAPRWIQIVIPRVRVGTVESERIPIGDEVPQIRHRNGKTKTLAERQLHVDHTDHFTS